MRYHECEHRDCFDLPIDLESNRLKIIFKTFLTSFGPVLGQFRTSFGPVLGNFWTRFGPFFSQYTYRGYLVRASLQLKSLNLGRSILLRFLFE